MSTARKAAPATGPPGVPSASARRRPGRTSGHRQSVAPQGASWTIWMKLIVAAVILVYIGRIHEAIPGVGAIPIGNVVTLAMIGILLVGGYYTRLTLLWRTRPFRFAVILLGLGALSIPFALWPGGAVGAWTGALKTWLLCAIIPLAVVTSRQLTWVGRCFVIATLILVSGYLLEAFAGMSGFTQSQSLGFDRNDVALLAAMGVPFALAWGKVRKRYHVLGYLITALLVLGVIVTGSRGGFLALAALAIAFLVRSRMLSWPKKSALVVLAVMLAGAAGSTEYWDRIESIFTNPTEDYNFQAREGRIEIWKRGLSYAVDNPVTGVGFGNFPVAEGHTLENLGYGVKWSTAHNAYVLVLAELGLPGLLVFLAIIGSIVRTVRHCGTRKLSRRARASPAGAELAEIATLSDATALAMVGYAVGAFFLSAAYNVAFVFLITMAISLQLVHAGVVRRMMRPEVARSRRSMR